LGKNATADGAKAGGAAIEVGEATIHGRKKGGKSIVGARFLQRAVMKISTYCELEGSFLATGETNWDYSSIEFKG